MASIDYAFKSKVLKEEKELIKRYKQATLNDYLKRLYYEEGIICNKPNKSGQEETLNDLEFWCFLNHKLEELNEIERITKASRARTKRLYKRVSKILLNGNCIFLTLTFTNQALEETSQSTRRKYVSRFLKKYDCLYVANIDFGKTNQREHYHALISTNKVNHKDWLYGDIDFKRVRNKNIQTDTKRLSKYIAKLSNHAIKETTQRCCLLYSR